MFPSVALYFETDSSDSDGENTRLRRRKLRDTLNVLDLPEERFITTFRISKELFVKLLEEIKPKLELAYRNTHIAAPTKLATFLSFLATGGYQASIGNEYVSSMSKSKVSMVISELLNIFEEHISPKWIRLENSLDEENEAKESFYRIAGIPGVVGCVDGTHVRVKAPSNERKHLYYTRKGFYSMNVMLICDQNMVIRYVDARHPGSNNDAFIWDQSAANQHLKTNYFKGKRDTWLLGDSGYKLQPYLLTPYISPKNDSQKKYNEKHAKTRNVMEKCIGVLKNRFRCILSSRELHYSPEKATKIINACCTLHNMCIFYKHKWELYDDEYWEPSDNENGKEYDDSEAYSEEANLIRNQISRNLC